jgi:two-component system, cell cycle response regulator
MDNNAETLDMAMPHRPELLPISDDLLAENLHLRERLADLLDQARRNQQIMLRHQNLDLKLIGADSFKDLIDNIFHTLAKVSELDIVTLTLLDPEYDIQRILINLDVDVGEFPNLFFLQHATELGELHGRLHKPVLCRYSSQRHQAFFPAQGIIPASVATVPLLRNNTLIGCLNLGSLNETRFIDSMGTDFIEHQASIVALCIENVINNERLKYIGLTDALTGVHNRRYVERRLHEEIGRARRQEHALSCLYIDIDHFKRVNDSVGHQGGDDVLREVSARVKAELRLSDVLGRFGGEEFVVLLINAEQADALNIAERIRAGIADLPLTLASGCTVDVTVSIGVATLTDPYSSPSIDRIAQGLIARADQALYRAKESGRNRIVV